VNRYTLGPAGLQNFQQLGLAARSQQVLSRAANSQPRQWRKRSLMLQNLAEFF
jgi:hypothetical protein